jgi:hypothetical protein
MHIFFKIELDVINSFLTYVGTVAGTSIGGYIWSALKKDTRNHDLGTDSEKSDQSD